MTAIHKNIYKKVILFATSLVLSGTIQAQSKVDVVKPYEPVIRDAFKISKMPQIKDSTNIEVHFDYEITPRSLSRSFQPKEIKPARMKGEPLSDLERGFVRASLGNYIAPMIDFNIQSLRSSEYHWGVNMWHESMHGKIMNQFDNKTFAGYSESMMGLFGRRMLGSTRLYGDINFKSNMYHYYGLTLDDPGVDVQNTEFEKGDLDAQTLNSFVTKIGVNSTHLNVKKLKYDIYGQFRHTNGRENVKEDIVDVSVDLDYYFNHQFLGTKGKIQYITTNQLSDTVNNLYIHFNPWIGAFGKKWRIQAGVNTIYDEKTSEYYFYPDVKLHYNIVRFILVPYVEYSGNYQINSFHEISGINHFIVPNTYTKPSINKQIITGGLRGNFSSRLGFNLNVTVKQTDDQYFFTDADSTNYIQQFTVVYDNMTQTRFLAEISYKQSEKLNILFQGEYNKYSLDSLVNPYYMPVYKITASARYNLKNKFIFKSDLFYHGERYGHEINTGDVKLNDIFDLNLGAEYKYNYYLSAFVEFNNILAQQRYEWINYRLKGFQFHVGGAYRF